MAAPCGEAAVVGVDLTTDSAVLVERLRVLARIGVRRLILVHVLGGHYPQIPQLPCSTSRSTATGRSC